MLRVTAVTPLEGYKLEIGYNDGVVSVVDCSFLLHGTLGEPLKDLDYFRQVRVDHDVRTIGGQTGSIRRQNSSTVGRNQSTP